MSRGKDARLVLVCPSLRSVHASPTVSQVAPHEDHTFSLCRGLFPPHRSLYTASDRPAHSRWYSARLCRGCLQLQRHRLPSSYAQAPELGRDVTCALSTCPSPACCPVLRFYIHQEKYTSKSCGACNRVLRHSKLCILRDHKPRFWLMIRVQLRTANMSSLL